MVRVKAHTRSFPTSKSRASTKRKPEPPKKKRKKPKKDRAPKHSKGMKATENKLVPGLNPAVNDNDTNEQVVIENTQPLPAPNP